MRVSSYFLEISKDDGSYKDSKFLGREEINNSEGIIKLFALLKKSLTTESETYL